MTVGRWTVDGGADQSKHGHDLTNDKYGDKVKLTVGLTRCLTSRPVSDSKTLLTV